MRLVLSMIGIACALECSSAAGQSFFDPDLIVTPMISYGGPLVAPTALAFIGTDNILVCEKNTGRVRRVFNGVLQPESACDLAVNSTGERGLLGMALSPAFPDEPLVYLFYTRSSTGSDTAVSAEVSDHRIVRFTWNGTALVNEQTLLVLDAPPGVNHEGGTIVFGPPSAPPAQQKLFAVIGDMARNNQTQNYASGAAPDDTGCVIRINPDGSTPSGTDKGPFFDVPGANASLKRMYAYGIRNSFGIAFDPHPVAGGALWESENGLGDYDEINRVDPAFNSGWEDQMGPTGFPDVDEPAPGKVQFGGIGTYSDPEFSWKNIVAPTAVHFHSGAGLGESYRYDCFVGSIMTPKLYRFRLNGPRTGFLLSGDLSDLVFDGGAGEDESQVVAGHFPALTDIETGPDGNLFLLSYSMGQIYRVSVRPAGASDWELY